MAISSKKVTYPRFPPKLWWNLRRQFQKSTPVNGVVTDNYLATIWETTPESVRNNYLSPLKRLGLIDNENRITDRAMRWREDDEYKNVCEEILHEIYPQELLDIGPDYDRNRVETWFGRFAGVGEKAKQDMATLFLLLVKGDPSEQDAVVNTQRKAQVNSTTVKPRKQEQKSTKRRIPKEASIQLEGSTEALNGQNKVTGTNLSLHIDIQVHISPEASAEGTAPLTGEGRGLKNGGSIGTMCSCNTAHKSQWSRRSNFAQIRCVPQEAKSDRAISVFMTAIDRDIGVGSV